MSENMLTKLDCWTVVLAETKIGHKSAAKQLLKQISKALETDPSSIPEDVNQWLAEAITKILSDPKRAARHLRLTGKKKYPKESDEYIYDFICESGLGLHKDPGNIKGEGKGAFFAAGEESHISASSAETIHTRLRGENESLTELCKDDEFNINGSPKEH